jgi:hypothetical protein
MYLTSIIHYFHFIQTQVILILRVALLQCPFNDSTFQETSEKTFPRILLIALETLIELSVSQHCTLTESQSWKLVRYCSTHYCSEIKQLNQ